MKSDVHHHYMDMTEKHSEGEPGYVTRSDLMQILAAKNPALSERQIESSVRVILETIAKSLAKGDRVEIRGFGVFTLHYRKPRTGRNPKSGKKVLVPAKYAPHFKPGKDLRDRVDSDGR